MLLELRAIEALGIIVAVFLVAFSAIYLAMSHESGTTFTLDLDHVQALYFTITVFSTVGFGDITPHTDAARLVVSAQMLLDLVIDWCARPIDLQRRPEPGNTGAPCRRRLTKGREPDRSAWPGSFGS